MKIEIEQAEEPQIRELRMRAITRGEVDLETFVSICEALEDVLGALAAVDGDIVESTARGGNVAAQIETLVEAVEEEREAAAKAEEAQRSAEQKCDLAEAREAGLVAELESGTGEDRGDGFHEHGDGLVGRQRIHERADRRGEVAPRRE